MTTPGARQGETADQNPRRRAGVRSTAKVPQPRFRTVLVAEHGWPTEASIPSAHKRSAKR